MCAWFGGCPHCLVRPASCSAVSADARTTASPWRVHRFQLFLVSFVEHVPSQRWRSKFSVGWTGAGCCALSRAATRTRHQVVQRWHLPPTRRFLIPNTCHVGADWASGNRWAGRRCVVPQGRGSGCCTVISRVVCCPPIFTTSVRWRTGSTHDTALVHTRVVKEQQSNHKLFHSVKFQVRCRAQGAAPSSIRLDHGDFLVMDGLAQPEHVHRTVSGPTGSSGCLTFRW